MSTLLNHARKLIARGADPSRGRPASGTSIYNIHGWMTLSVVSISFVSAIFGVGITVALSAILDLRMINSEEARIVDKLQGVGGNLEKMSSAEIELRLSTPLEAFQFTADLLKLTAQAPKLPTPDWARRIGLVSQYGRTVDIGPVSRAEAFKDVVELLSVQPHETRAIVLDRWTQMVAIEQDIKVINLLWAIAKLPTEKKDALLNSGFPPVPDNETARAIYSILPTVSDRKLSMCLKVIKE